MTSGRLFILGLLVFGVIAGLVVVNVPAARSFPLPSIVWPLAAALLSDLALMPFIREGRIAPVGMNERAIGVIGSALIITVMQAVAPA